MNILKKGLLADAAVNFYVIDATEMVEKARGIHDTSPVCTAALGRSLMAASIMGSMQKGEKDQVSLIVKGGGPAGNIVCVGRTDGTVKGYIANPGVDLPPRADGKLDVGGAVGADGTLTVITDLGLKEPYIGQSALVSGEIAEDLASYYYNSQQQPTAVYLGVHMNSSGVSSACGLVIQAMPFCPDKVLDVVESRMGAATELNGLVEAGMSLEQYINWLFTDLNPVFTETLEPDFSCDCSRDRITQALLSMGEKELMSMAEEQHGAELTCHFCNAKYNFGEEELRQIAAAASAAAAAGKDLDE